VKKIQVMVFWVITACGDITLTFHNICTIRTTFMEDENNGSIIKYANITTLCMSILSY